MTSTLLTKFDSRTFNPDIDLGEVKGWWEDHAGPFPHMESLISRTGIIIPNLCASWLYLTDSNMSFLGWTVSRPDAPVRDVHRGIKQVYEELAELAKENGTKVIMSLTPNKGLIKILKSIGFMEGDLNATTMLLGV